MSINIINLTFIEYKTKRFYISQSPTNENMENFISQLKANNIKHVVRLCKPTYDSLQIENESIGFYDLEIPDGDIPNKNHVDQWTNIVNNALDNEGILVHCVAGLGRAPIMVTLSLINEGLEPFEAIELIRKRRPGSINSKQLGFLMNYKPNKKKTFFLFKFLLCK